MAATRPVCRGGESLPAGDACQEMGRWQSERLWSELFIICREGRSSSEPHCPPPTQKIGGVTSRIPSPHIAPLEQKKKKSHSTTAAALPPFPGWGLRDLIPTTPALFVCPFGQRRQWSAPPLLLPPPLFTSPGGDNRSLTAAPHPHRP